MGAGRSGLEGRNALHVGVAVLLALGGAGAASASAVGTPAVPAQEEVLQWAGVSGEFSPYAPLRADVVAQPRQMPREAYEADDDVAPGRAEARASSAAANTPGEAGDSTLALWLAGLGAMLFVAWRLKGD
jgi:hypothetical protein